MATTYSYGKLDELDYKQEAVHIGDVPFSIQNSQSLVSLSSTNAEDSNKKSGARTVQIIGADKDYVRKSEIIQLNGTEPVSSRNEYIFIEKAEVVRTGPSGFNKGSIVVSGVENKLANILPFKNRMRNTASVVYEGNVGFIESWGCAQGTENRLSPIDCVLYQRLKNGIVRPIDEATVFPDSNGHFKRNFKGSVGTGKSSIFYITAQTKGEGAQILGSIELSLERKE